MRTATGGRWSRRHDVQVLASSSVQIETAIAEAAIGFAKAGWKQQTGGRGKLQWCESTKSASLGQHAIYNKQ